MIPSLVAPGFELFMSNYFANSQDAYREIKNAMQIFEINCEYSTLFGVKVHVLHLWGGHQSVRLMRHYL